MNERIKQLAEKATVFVADYDGQRWQIDPEKFAELIVKECANAADMAQDAGCEYAGDYVAEYMGFGQEHGVTEWRAK
jgi:hypothetical protein